MNPVPNWQTTPANVYDEVARLGYGDAYGGVLESYEDAFVAGRVQRMLRGAAIRLGRTARVLDAGCGTGEALGSLNGLPSSHYTGVDISPRMIREAHNRHASCRARFICADFAEYAPAPKPDLIVSLWGPFNYAGLGRSLGWAARALAPGGSLLAVLYGAAHEYSDRALYPPGLRACIPSGINATREGARQAARVAFPAHHIEVLPFSSEAIAKATPSPARWEQDLVRLRVDSGTESRYLLLEVVAAPSAIQEPQEHG